MFKEPGITGKIVEKELFSECTEDQKMLEKQKRLLGKYEDPYINFNNSVNLVKESQPFDPSEPDPDFAWNLHASVAEELGLEDYSDIKLYTAVNSYLDKKHGVDAFFEYKINAKLLRVTIDVTTNPNKDSHKADVIFHVPSDGIDRKLDEDKELFKQIISEVSNEVVDILNTKIKTLKKETV